MLKLTIKAEINKNRKTNSYLLYEISFSISVFNIILFYIITPDFSLLLLTVALSFLQGMATTSPINKHIPTYINNAIIHFQ